MADKDKKKPEKKKGKEKSTFYIGKLPNPWERKSGTVATLITFLDDDNTEITYLTAKEYTKVFGKEAPTLKKPTKPKDTKDKVKKTK